MKYVGSKWDLSKILINAFPEHHSYLEPFFGSGAVFFNKPASNIETINDIDNNVINLFECIKEDPERLGREIALIPYSRVIYEKAWTEKPKDKWDKASKFLIRCDMSHGFRNNKVPSGWKCDIQGREANYAVKHWNNIPSIIAEAGIRLKNAQIENRDFRDIFKRFNFENVFIYADHPYLLTTRYGKQYNYEFSETDHEDLLALCVQHKGKVMISGYDNDMYNEILKGWNKQSFQTRNQLTAKRQETIWYNYETPVKQISFM